MRLDEVLNMPEGKFRCFWKDNFEEEFFIVGDFDNPDDAIGRAQEKEREEPDFSGEPPNEVATTFYAINDIPIFLYGLPIPFLGRISEK